MNDAPIFILGAHKSGTSLLRSLINGAPGIFVVPLEAHFFQFTGFWVDYALRRNAPRTQSFEQTVDILVQHIRDSNEIVVTTRDSVLAGRWDVVAFRDYLIAHAAPGYNAGDWRRFFDIYIEAIHVGLFGTPPTAERYAEKTVENAEYAAFLQKLYPDARFVHIVRNPYANLVSLRRYIARNGRYPLLGRSLTALNNTYYHLYKNPLIIPNYLVIRYEDLLREPRTTMQRIAQHIGAPFSDSFLIPTALDEPWMGNSTSGEAFSGISTRPLTEWRQHIHPLEIAFVNRLFPHVLRDFDYEVIEAPGRFSLYRRAPSERIKAYVMNRWVWMLMNKSVIFPA